MQRENFLIAAARPIQILTSREYLLPGLWFGPQHPRAVIIFLHGLAGSVFSRIELTQSLVGPGRAVLTFNNRGSGLLNWVKKRKGRRKGFESELIGQAHEVFTDSRDDIAGAVRYALKQGAKEIYLLGHSTGCQKSVYYLAGRPDRRVRGAVLLAPISDYASEKHFMHKKVLQKALRRAKLMMKHGQAHRLLPEAVWPYPLDAQRFLSLNTPHSVEEIFSYAQPQKRPRLLQKVRVPLLFVFAGADEHRDRPTEKLVAWFRQVLRPGQAELSVISRAGHNFHGYEPALKRVINRWLTRQVGY